MKLLIAICSCIFLAIASSIVSNVLKVGATRKGKTLSAAAEIANAPHEAVIVLDPHTQSLAQAVIMHVTGNVLFERLSDVRRTLGFDFLTPSTHSDAVVRQLENERRSAAFVDILLRRRKADSMASSPLMDEWISALILCFLSQARRKPLTILPFGFMPDTPEFAALARDCTLPEIRHKFQQLEKLSPRALRAEVGSALRLISPVFRSPAFSRRCRGGFNLGAFLERKGRLVMERGDDIGDDTMRTIMGAIDLLVIDYAKRRRTPYPPIRVYIDEATNAGLFGTPELHGLAETNKNGLYWTPIVQNLDFPGGAEAVLQNCLRHEWFGCPNYDLARKAAVDVLAGLAPNEQSRAERLEALTHEIMNLPPGWRWVRDPSGSRREYVPLLQNPWPDWPGLRQAKLQERLQCIYSRTEYRVPDDQPSENFLEQETRRRAKSRGDSSPARRLKRPARKPPDSSERNDDAGASPSADWSI